MNNSNQAGAPPLFVAVFLFLLSSTLGWAQFTLTSPNTDWVTVPYRASAVLDAAGDQATGTGETDIVGNSTHASFLTKFVAGSTNTTGTLYFRVRVGADQGSAGFTNGVMIGMDGNQDGQLDVFVGVRSTPRIWKSTGTQCISPATTALKTGSPVKKYSSTTANYNWSAVSAALDPQATSLDLNTAGGTDYFVSFAIPFADVVAAFASKGITFNSTKIVTYVLGTGVRAKTYDEDMNGVSGGVNSTTPWAALGALSQPLIVTGTASNTAPVNTVPGARTANGSAALTGVSVADAQGNIATVQISATNGTVNVSLSGGALIISGANNSATFTLAGTPAQINAALATLGYTPTLAYTGPATVTMLSKDSSDATASSSIPITVINTANTAPVAANDSATTHANKAVTTYVIGNDFDADGNVLTITAATLTSGLGTFSFANGNVTYTPLLNSTGTATISYTISDGRGGTSSAVLTITVTANGTPVAVNDTGTANLNTTVSFDVLANDSDPDGDTLTISSATRTSGQGTVSVVADEIEFSSPNSFGTTVISYTISDGYGGTATATLTVVSGTNSVPVAVNDSANANSGATVSIDALANDTDANNDVLMITDASLTSGQGVVSAIDGKVQFTPSSSFAGTATISYTIDDNRGGTATATITVAVTDATPPTISGTFSPLSVATGAGGTVALQSYTSQAVTSDNIGVTSVTQSPAAGSARSVGTTAVTLTAKDAAGNQATTTFNVTVTDGTAPTISGPFSPTSFITGSNGTAALPNYTSQAVTSDNVAVTSITQSPTAGSTRGVGTTTVTLTASDAAGNTASTNFNVTITDGTAPTIGGTFTPLGLTTGAAGTATLPSYTSQAVTSDNVGVTSVTQSPAAGSARSAGTTTVTLTAFDAAGNTASTSFNVTVADGTAPTISGTFSPLTYATGAGGTVTLPSYISQAVTSDNVGVTSVTQSPAAGSARSVGTTTVILTAKDAAGNQASTSFNLTITDGTAPTISGTFSPLSLTTGANGTVALPSYTSQAVTSDNVAVTSVTQSPAAGSARGAGITTVTLTASDAAGNTASTSFDVTVADGTAPTIGGTFSPLTIATGAGGTVALPSYTSQAVTSDNVAVTSVTQSPAAGSARSVGTTTVTLTASDAAGNTASTSFNVAVADGTEPAISGTFSPLTLATGAGGTVALPSYTSQAITSDNVAVTSVTQSPAVGSARSVGTTTVTLTAADAAGNTATTSFDVTITDATAPAISGTFSPLTIKSGAGGIVALSDYTGQAVTSDNVAVVSITQSPAAGTTRGVGTTRVTLTAADAEGNNASTSFDVTVEDGTAPTISGTFSPLTLATGPDGSVSLPSYTAQAVTSDNIGVTSVTQSPAAGTALSAGTTTVTLTAHDAEGNTASTSFDLTVSDNTVPTIGGTFSPLTLTTGPGGIVALPDYRPQATADDNVGVTSVTQSPAVGSARSAGTTVVTLTASDAAGNTASTTFDVTVNDGTSPMISGTFSPRTLATGVGGTVALPDYILQAVASDEVGVTNVTQSPTAGTVLEVGARTVILTASDAAGNTASTSFSLTIVDGTAPMISGTFLPLTLATGAGGTVFLPSYISQAVTSDEVGVTNVTQSPAAGAALTVGTKTVTLTASDAAGNTASTSFSLTVTDGTAPKISGFFSPRRLVTGPAGTVALPDYTSQAVTSDNEAVTSVTQSPVAGTLCSVGTTTVTLTASDAAENTASTSFEVTVSADTPNNAPPITLEATRITPGSAILSGNVIPGGVETQLSFQFSKSPTLASPIASSSVSVGSGTEEVIESVQLTDLDPNTRYYYRAVSTSTAGTFYGEVESLLTPVIVWGPPGALAEEGRLDATRIPNTTGATTYTDVSGNGYDVEISTSSLGGRGYTTVTGEPACWLEGSASTSSTASTVRVRIYENGTTNPFGVMGVHFRIDDAELTETLLNFTYFRKPACGFPSRGTLRFSPTATHPPLAPGTVPSKTERPTKAWSRAGNGWM